MAGMMLINEVIDSSKFRVNAYIIKGNISNTPITIAVCNKAVIKDLDILMYSFSDTKLNYQL